VNAQGGTDLEGTVAVSGLGGNPYRDGSYEYYIGERTRTNDPKGLGAAIQAAVEMEKAETLNADAGATVLLDDFFNHEIKKDLGGRDVVWHYKWNEMPDAGFYAWGKIFESYGARTGTLSAAPTAANLKTADIYIIVDPDTDKESPAPNYIGPAHTKAISDWVKRGGVLVLMGNDAGNAELDKFSELAGVFGIRFNKDSKFRVVNNDFKMGSIVPNPTNPILRTPKQIYVKEVSTLSLTPPARAIVTANGDTIMAASSYGKGTVFVVGDPWLYNEYVDGRKLPAEFENFKAAQDLSRWLIAHTRKIKR
jgi:unsaturated rhamnogalacturonyl hydrolase